MHPNRHAQELFRDLPDRYDLLVDPLTFGRNARWRRTMVDRWAWRGYTRALLSLAGGIAGGRPWGRVGRFLGPNIERHYRHHPIERLRAAWQDAGFADVEVRAMSFGGGVVMWGTRTG